MFDKFVAIYTIMNFAVCYFNCVCSDSIFFVGCHCAFEPRLFHLFRLLFDIFSFHRNLILLNDLKDQEDNSGWNYIICSHVSQMVSFVCNHLHLNFFHSTVVPSPTIDQKVIPTIIRKVGNQECLSSIKPSFTCRRRANGLQEQYIRTCVPGVEV